MIPMKPPLIVDFLWLCWMIRWYHDGGIIHGVDEFCIFLYHDFQGFYYIMMLMESWNVEKKCRGKGIYGMNSLEFYLEKMWSSPANMCVVSSAQNYKITRRNGGDGCSCWWFSDLVGKALISGKLLQENILSTLEICWTVLPSTALRKEVHSRNWTEKVGLFFLCRSEHVTTKNRQFHTIPTWRIIPLGKWTTFYLPSDYLT